MSLYQRCSPGPRIPVLAPSTSEMEIKGVLPVTVAAEVDRMIKRVAEAAKRKAAINKTPLNKVSENSSLQVFMDYFFSRSVLFRLLRPGTSFVTL